MKYSIKLIGCLSMLTVLLSGCAGMTMTKPDLAQQLDFDSTLLEQYHIDESWWLIYNDNQLNQLIESAINSNIDLAKSAININKALYQANLMGADLVPAFSGGLSGSSSKNLKQSDSSTQSFGSNLSLNYEIDLWRKLRDSIDAKEWEYNATIEDKAAIKLTLINHVIDTYYQLAYLNEALNVTKKNINNYQKIEDIERTKFNYGKSDELDVSQARQSLLSAQNSLLDYQKQQKIMLQTLRDLLNLRPSDPMDIRYPDLSTLQIPIVDLNVPLALLANRPDLKAAQYRLLSAFKDVKASEKELYPSISINAAIKTSSDKIRTGFDVPFGVGSVSINLPFLQWNKIKWNIKTSEANYESVYLNFEQSITTALNEIDTYYYSYNNAKAALDNIEKKHVNDIKIRKYREARYQVGKDELSDWLNAINTELNSRLSLLKSRYQLINSENMIYKAMAGRVSNTDHTKKI